MCACQLSHFFFLAVSSVLAAPQANQYWPFQEIKLDTQQTNHNHQRRQKICTFSHVSRRDDYHHFSFFLYLILYISFVLQQKNNCSNILSSATYNCEYCPILIPLKYSPITLNYQKISQTRNVTKKKKNTQQIFNHQ